MNGEKLPSFRALSPKWRLFLGFALFALGGALVWNAMNSNLFAVRQLTVTANSVEGFSRNPVAIEEMESRVRAQMGSESLFKVSAAKIRQGLLENLWIKDARVRKGMDGVIHVQVDFRTPVAIEISDHGARYLDGTGLPYGQLSLELGADFPVVDVQEKDRAFAVELTRLWVGSPVGRWLRLMSVEKHTEAGWILTTAYQLNGEGSESSRTARMSIELGPELDEPAKILSRISKMGKYLVTHGIEALSAKAADGKKLVVKTARRS